MSTKTRDIIGGIAILLLIAFTCTYKSLPTYSRLSSHFKSKQAPAAAHISSTRDLDMQTIGWKSQPTNIVAVMKDGDEALVRENFSRNGMSYDDPHTH